MMLNKKVHKIEENSKFEDDIYLICITSFGFFFQLYREPVWGVEEMQLKTVLEETVQL